MYKNNLHIAYSIKMAVSRIYYFVIAFLQRTQGMVVI